jgi:UDP-2-acetamido-2,6-beta-L-arabino-hexul-4-ose reductase
MQMNRIRIGITGQAGFIGTHLYNELGLLPEQFERIPFEDEYFQDEEKLCSFVKSCDAIVHLAAVNRHPDENELYRLNIHLVKTLIDAMIKENVTPHVLFSSSTQEALDNIYGKSKKEGRKLLEDWASEKGASLTGLIIPNVYGPFGRPNYNSFVATFCYKLLNNETPQIIHDNDVNLIYVSSLCKYIISEITDGHSSSESLIKEEHVPFDFTRKVSEILSTLKDYKEKYFDAGIIPVLKDKNDVNLFNTFQSYISYKEYFPFLLKQNTDDRGTFVETIKLGIGGQVSFSTTKPGITRGNHYHTRKIERFTVIKGKAKIQLRKIGTNEILDFYLDGENPSYVDMPIWYTHNITNIGTDDLYTQFWINEWYVADDPDTYFEEV